MKPIKCWIAQRLDTKSVYVHSNKPSLDSYLKRWYSEKAPGYIGKNLLIEDKKPIKCVIITEQYYKELLEKARLK